MRRLGQRGRSGRVVWLPVPLPVAAARVWRSCLPPLYHPCRRMTRREVIAVANTATLETAVRGCMEDGATKVGGWASI